jgi:hypothetical protein
MAVGCCYSPLYLLRLNADRGGKNQGYLMINISTDIVSKINLIKRQQQNWNCIRLVFCAVRHFWQIRQIGFYLPRWSRRRRKGRITRREIVGAFLTAAVRLERKKKNNVNEKEFGWQRKMTAESKLIRPPSDRTWNKL